MALASCLLMHAWDGFSSISCALSMVFTFVGQGNCAHVNSRSHVITGDVLIKTFS